jgi:hypothetical protein
MSAHIIWLDDEGAKHLCVAWTVTSALEQLDVIEQQAGLQLMACVVKSATCDSCAGIMAVQEPRRQEQL